MTKKQLLKEKALEAVSDKLLDVRHYDTAAMGEEDYEREFKEIYDALQLAQIALGGE